LNIDNCKENINKYFEIRRRIINELKNLAGSIGLKITIISKERAYPRLKPCDNFPDIFILPGEEYNSVHGVAVSINPKKKTFIKKIENKSGNHRMWGIFAIQGPNIKKGLKVNDIAVEDIAPLSYMLLGIPIPDFVDGRLPLEIFENKPKEIKYSDGKEITHLLIKYRLKNVKKKLRK